MGGEEAIGKREGGVGAGTDLVRCVAVDIRALGSDGTQLDDERVLGSGRLCDETHHFAALGYQQFGLQSTHM